jgi:hypothetical protein
VASSASISAGTNRVKAVTRAADNDRVDDLVRQRVDALGRVDDHLARAVEVVAESRQRARHVRTTVAERTVGA